MSKKIKVGVIFGSRSVEHEVSVITAKQAMENFDRGKYEVIPIHIDKTGRWMISGKEYFFAASPGAKTLLPTKQSFFKKSSGISLDIAMPLVHGTFGEDGTLQGLLEMANVPYTGCGVTAAAVSMDKTIQKAVFEKVGLPVVNHFWFLKNQWQRSADEILNQIEKELTYPLFVKPNNLGSSVGINKAVNREELKNAIEIAIHFDRQILIEEGKENIVEINCSVLGYNDDLMASVCEQPINNSSAMLTYEDKYGKDGGVKGMKGMLGLSRLVPAPISDEFTKKIQEASKTAFRAIDASGVARIDFLVDLKQEKFWVNEINTLPGSLSFYLWEKSGIKFSELLDKLVALGFARYEERKKLIYEREIKQ